MAYRFDIRKHCVFDLGVILKSHQAPPDSIILELTIQACLMTLQHNSLANRSSISNTLFRRITLEYDFSILENGIQLHQTLAPYLNGLEINTGSVNYDKLIREIMERGLGMVNRGDKGVVLPLLVNVLTCYVEHNHDDLMRALEESEAELERTNYGMVAAKVAKLEPLLPYLPV